MFTNVLDLQQVSSGDLSLSPCGQSDTNDLDMDYMIRRFKEFGKNFNNLNTKQIHLFCKTEWTLVDEYFKEEKFEKALEVISTKLVFWDRHFAKTPEICHLLMKLRMGRIFCLIHLTKKALVEYRSRQQAVYFLSKAEGFLLKIPQKACSSARLVEYKHFSELITDGKKLLGLTLNHEFRL